MGTTANNSLPYPESSDYVADGATAIENLADAIDPLVGNVTALYRTASLSVANTTETDVPYASGSTVVDTSNWHDESTNNERITPTIAGYYLVISQVTLDNSSLATSVRIFNGIQKNTTFISSASVYSPNYPTAHTHAVVSLNGSTDYIKQRVYHNQGTTQNVNNLRLSLFLLREI